MVEGRSAVHQHQRPAVSDDVYEQGHVSNRYQSGAAPRHLDFSLKRCHGSTMSHGLDLEKGGLDRQRHAARPWPGDTDRRDIRPAMRFFRDMVSSALFAAAQAGHAAAAAHGAFAVQLWQVINLIGAPLVAIMFVGPVVEDVRSWISSLRDR